MLRLETTKASAHSQPFTLDEAVMLQAKQPAEGIAIIDIFAKVDQEAEWAQVASWKPHEQGMCALGKLPFLKLRVTGHIEGQPLKVWCSTPAPAVAKPHASTAEPINQAAAASHLDSAGIPDKRIKPRATPILSEVDDGPEEMPAEMPYPEPDIAYPADDN